MNELIENDITQKQFHQGDYVVSRDTYLSLNILIG